MIYKKLYVLILILCVSLLPISIYADTTTKDYKIMNSPTATKQQIKTWARNNNASELYISLIDIAYDIAVTYELDPTVMLAQTALETNYCKYGGVIDDSYHNTAGMKTSKGGGNYSKSAHQIFDSWEHGFTAQAQHLRLYAGYCHHYRNDCPHECPEIYDPRHFKEIGGKATYVSDLSRTWASDSTYGNKLNRMCEDIVNTKTEEPIKEASKSDKKELTPIERLKARLIGTSNSKVSYIKDILFNRDKEKLMKEYIQRKFKK